MNGEYKEKLLSGGELSVTKNSWSIKYYFSGPDLRYNGTFVTVPGEKINDYIEAWRNNFKKYILLKASIPSGGKFETNGEMGMSIRVGWGEGVCLKAYHMPINTEDKLRQVTEDYSIAKERAIIVQEMLKKL